MDDICWSTTPRDDELGDFILGVVSRRIRRQARGDIACVCMVRVCLFVAKAERLDDCIRVNLVVVSV
jgi:hypothetical protein